MVKTFFLVFIVCIATKSYCQNLSLGVGARASNNWVQNRTEFNFDILSNDGDTLLLKDEETKAELINGLSFPIYIRYTSKHNWWAQVNYGYETWRLGIKSSSRLTDFAVQKKLDERISELGDTPSEELREAIEGNIISDGTTEFESFERIQFNKLTFTIGSSVNRRGIATFYYGAGFDFYTTSTFESYQGLVYDNEDVSLTHHILEAMPKLASTQIAPFFNLGIEKQNIRLGLDFAFYPGPVFGEHNENNEDLPLSAVTATATNDFTSQLVKNIASLGVSLNYTLFNQNFNQAISADKKNVLDPLVIGRYRQKPKLIQYGVSLNFPSFHNSGWSAIDGFQISKRENLELNNDLIDNDDNYLSGILFNPEIDEDDGDTSIISDFIYLEEQDRELIPNDDGSFDTSYTSTTLFFALGNINSIVKSPKISGFVRINPHELFSADFNVGYQNHTYGIRAYETERETIGDETTVQTRKLVYQENFHELSLGLNAYAQMPINNISKLGFHVGLNYNAWFNGVFESELGGINDSELLEDFHNYFAKDIDQDNDEAGEWKTDEASDLTANDKDKGIFTKKDYVDYKYNDDTELESYYTDFTPYLFNSVKKRSYFELRFGVDYYVENLKFNIYAERSLLRNKTFYNSLFTVGMGVSLFLD